MFDRLLLRSLPVSTFILFAALLFALPALAATAPTTTALDPKVAALLVAGAAVVKLAMTLLDKANVLEKLPPWLRPHVTIVLAALVVFLEQLVAGTNVYTALLGFLAAVVFSDKAHQTLRGIKLHGLWKAAR